MRVTVCELPHEAEALGKAWAALCAHASRARSELVVLPELPFAPALWLEDAFDEAKWRAAEAAHERWLARLPELGAGSVIGTRPRTVGDGHSNEGFLWSAGEGLTPLRSKHYLPDEAEAWEARWFTAGDREFPAYAAGTLRFGLNICTELWALESYGGYRAANVDAVVAPRATAGATTDKWLAIGTVGAVSAGAYCLSSNRVEPDGSCGGVGWIIDPDGALLATTNADMPFATVEIDLAKARAASRTYPRYVFARPGSQPRDPRA